MNQSDQQWQAYREARDAALEGTASSEQIHQLEQFVLSSDEMKRDYAEHAHQVAALATEVFSPSTAASNVGGPAAGSGSLDSAQRDDRKRSRLGTAVAVVASLAATILLTLAVSGNWRSAETGFAVIVDTERCQWGESSLPTSVDQRLGAGRMQLNSGIAKIRFPKVDVTFEGPADFEIIDAKTCRLHRGRAYASVETGGEDFEIRTPTSTLIDRGTVFGVSVSPSGTSDLQVFEGQVDVKHHPSGRALSVTTDQNLRFSKSGIGSIQQVIEPTFQPDSELDDVGHRSVQISTAIGRGADGYVSPETLPPSSSSNTALLVKRPAMIDDSGAIWQRKAFLRFDMSFVQNAEVVDAELRLQGVATHIGFASLMPDATFHVFGLLDESQDHWTEDGLSWEDAPAGDGRNLDLNPQQCMLVGTFVVEQSNPTGSFRVGGELLRNFLKSDTNGLVTLAVIAETVGEGGAYVHGFASKRHPELPAPTLRLSVE